MQLSENAPVIPADSVASNNKPYLYSIAFLFLLAMHYYQPNGGGQGLSLAFNNTAWIVISLLIAVGGWRMSRVKAIRYTHFDIATLIGIGLLALPLLWAESPWREANYDRYLAIMALWLIILTHRQFSLTDKERTVFWALIGGGVLIQCIIGLVQYAHSGEWMIIPNGRPAGTFQQVNVYASFLATGLGISIFQLCQQSLPRLLAITYGVVIFLVSVLQWLVLSRTGLLASLLVLFGLTLLYRKQKKTLLLIWVLVAMGLSAAIGLQNLTQLEGRSSESVAAPGYRTIQYSLSWELIKEKPLLGHGLGKFQTVFLHKQAKAYASGQIDSTYGSAASSHPHNELLFWWVEAGLLPILVFFSLAGFVICRLLHNKNHSPIVYIIILLPILLHTQTEYPLYHSSIHLLLLGLLLVFITAENTKSVSLQFTNLPVLFGGLFFVLCALFMSTNLHTVHVIGRYAESGEPQYLAKVVNPLGQTHHLNRFRSRELIKTNSLSSLALAKQLLVYEITLRPNEEAYAYLHEVYRLQGESAKVQQLLAKTKGLFPASDYFIKQMQFDVE